MYYITLCLVVYIINRISMLSTASRHPPTKVVVKSEYVEIALHIEMIIYIVYVRKHARNMRETWEEQKIHGQQNTSTNLDYLARVPVEVTWYGYLLRSRDGYQSRSPDMGTSLDYMLWVPVEITWHGYGYIYAVTINSLYWLH